MGSGAFTTKDGTSIFYKDWGSGQPMVFHHGWPLSSDDWDNQMLFFMAQGYRVIAHDRRGHGRSSQTDVGNDMDTYAADCDELFAHLGTDERDPRRPLDRRRRGRALCGAVRRQWPGRQGGPDQRHPAGDAEVRQEPRRDADGGVRPVPRRHGQHAPRPISISPRVRSTASTGPARKSPKAPSATGGARA